VAQSSAANRLIYSGHNLARPSPIHPDYFGSALKRFIGSMGEFSLKAGATGLEATAKKQIEAAALLGAASAKQPGDAAEAKQVPEERACEIASFVSKAITPKVTRRLDEASVL